MEYFNKKKTTNITSKKNNNEDEDKRFGHHTEKALLQNSVSDEYCDKEEEGDGGTWKDAARTNSSGSGSNEGRGRGREQGRDDEEDKDDRDRDSPTGGGGGHDGNGSGMHTVSSFDSIFSQTKEEDDYPHPYGPRDPAIAKAGRYIRNNKRFSSSSTYLVKE